MDKKEKVCVKKCKLDETRKFCLGCLRTIEQIIEKGKKYDNFRAKR